ncbi:hypothetical protein FHT67_002419 [Paenibacillus sp. BK720]|nr:hypothetical protein [Paenibacillus sp. BK720]
MILLGFFLRVIRNTRLNVETNNDYIDIDHQTFNDCNDKFSKIKPD